MNQNKVLYLLTKQILNWDISFIISDIIGNFEDIDVPSNVDYHNYTVDVDTPFGICKITITNNQDKKEVKFQRHVSDSFYEEYRLELNPQSEFYFCIDGRTVELRKKGFIINTIDKNYRFDEEKKEVTEITRILKKQEVYLYQELNKFSSSIKKDNKILLEALGSVDDKIGTFVMLSSFINTLAISLPSQFSSIYAVWPHVTINGIDASTGYPMNYNPNLVRRTFDIYQGIITSENYDDAMSLINRGHFFRSFSYEDYNNGNESINEKIDALIGKGARNYRQQYSSEVINVVKSFESYIKKDSFSLKTQEEKEADLSKNNYIKEILLSNRENI